MLHKLLTPVLFAALALPGMAQAVSPTGTSSYTLPDKAAEQFSPEAIQKTIRRYREKAENIANTAHKEQKDFLTKSPKTDQVRKLVRDVRRALGIQPDDGHLYIFVSLSMGDNMIRSYLKAGAWSGASVVVRGIPAGMDLATYVNEIMLPLVQKRAGAGININPTLFDQYGVDTVPTIVWQPGRTAECKQSTKVPMEDAEGVLRDVPRCHVTEREFWKVEGAVTVDWALDEFDKRGAEGAGRRLTIMRKNIGVPDGKDQQPFSGDWDDVAMPADDFDPAQPNRNPVVTNYSKGVVPPPPHTRPEDFEQ